MASVTQNFGVSVQSMFHDSPLCIFPLKDKDTVGVNIRKGVTSKCSNFHPQSETE